MYSITKGSKKHLEKNAWGYVPGETSFLLTSPTNTNVSYSVHKFVRG